MLDYDEELRVNYNTYQRLLNAIKNKDYDDLENLVNTKYDKLLSTYMKTSIKTLRKHIHYMKNSLIYTYNNGRIEGSNKKIKIINHIEYKYTKFNYKKNRIILHLKLKPIVQYMKKKHCEAA